MKKEITYVKKHVIINKDSMNVPNVITTLYTHQVIWYNVGWLSSNLFTQCPAIPMVSSNKP